jgi:hypothetical protein
MSNKDWPAHQLEPLHACHMVETMFEEFVTNADLVKGSAELSEKAETVATALADMYQAIGNADPDISMKQMEVTLPTVEGQ